MQLTCCYSHFVSNMPPSSSATTLSVPMAHSHTYRTFKVLFDTNRQAYIVSDLIEDQITLMLRDAGESVLSLSKAYVRYKGHHDVPVNSTMRARIWRR